MSFYDAIRVGASGAADFEVERSLRFNRADTNYIERTPSSNGNKRTWTFSAWIKRGQLTSLQTFFSAGTNNPDVIVKFTPSDQFEISRYGGSYQTQVTSTQLFRDPSAWYHIVGAVDTTQATASNRVKMYVNGTQITSFANSNYPSQNYEYPEINDTGFSNKIGKHGSNSQNFDGYMAEINFIDGLQLTPASFGETNAVTGQWVPIDTSGLTFGTNGFRLQLSDNSGTTATTLGKDTSGNGNNFTPYNFSVAAGAGNDSVSDSPTNNWATLNPLHWNVLKGAGGTANGDDFTQGNLRFVGPSSVTSPYNRQTASTIAVSSGAWYFEATIESMNNGVEIGFSEVDAIDSNGYYTGTWGFNPYDQRKFIAGTESTYGSQGSADDVLGFAFDLDNNTMELFINNSSQGQVTSIGISGKTVIVSVKLAFSNIKYTFNFGQQGFAYTPPTGFKALNSQNLPDPTIKLPNKHFDTTLYTGNGSTGQSITSLQFQPDWLWFKTRSDNRNNAVNDSVRGRAKGNYTDDTQGEFTDDAGRGLASFNANGFTVGEPQNASSHNKNGESIVNWAWNAGDTDSATYTVKVVSDSGNKYRFNNFGTSAVTLDLAEGGTYTFDGSDSSMSGHPFVIGTAANGSVYSTGVTYQLDGASVSYSAYTSGYASASTRKLIITVPASAPVLYYWCSIHSGMGGQINTNSTLGSSNFDGTIQSVVKANATAGFSIVTYTGNGTGGATIGHGLGVKPNWIIAKDRSAGRSWAVGSDDSPWSLNLRLNEISGAANTSQNGSQWYETTPTSTVFYVGNGDVGDYSGDTNVNGENYVAYCFSSVEGYSKFGKYTGNGNNDGPFVFTDFRPAWVMIKRSSASEGWHIFDNKRDPDNVIEDRLEANSNSASFTGYDWLDFLSNGFKTRINIDNTNGSGSTYIYFAFAESPFKNSRAR